MAWALSPHVTFCVAASEVILLDTARDRYFRLPAGKASSFLAWIEQGPDAPLPGDLASLHKGGLLRQDAAPGPIRPVRHAPPRGQVASAADARRGGGHIIDTLGSYWAVRRVLRRGLQPALDRILPPVRGTQSSENLAAHFLWVRGKLPRRPKCLLDSLAMVDFLHAQNAAASIIFGVHAQPFAAHCWVEHQGIVLNDSVDAVQTFTPILVR